MFVLRSVFIRTSEYRSISDQYNRLKSRQINSEGDNKKHEADKTVQNKKSE